MSIALDIITVLLILGFTIIGISKGLVKSFISLFSSIIALVVALVISVPLGNYLSDNFIQPTVESVFTKELAKAADVDVSNNSEENIEKIDVEDILKNVSEPVEKVLSIFGTSAQEVLNSVEKKASDTATQYKQRIINTVVEPVSNGIGRIAAFIILFILATIAIALISIPLNLISKLPIINKFNKAGGGILGLVQAVIIIFMLSSALSFLSPIIINENSAFTSSTIEETYIFKHIHNINPIK